MKKWNTDLLQNIIFLILKAVNESSGPQTSMTEINSQQGIKVDQDEPSKCSLLKAVNEFSGP
jgi:hypothetical protein